MVEILTNARPGMAPLQALQGLHSLHRLHYVEYIIHHLSRIGLLLPVRIETQRLPWLRCTTKIPGPGLLTGHSPGTPPTPQEALSSLILLVAQWGIDLRMLGATAHLPFNHEVTLATTE